MVLNADSGYRVVCPSCGKKYSVSDPSLSGKKTQCKKCTSVFIMALIPAGKGALTSGNTPTGQPAVHVDTPHANSELSNNRTSQRRGRTSNNRYRNRYGLYSISGASYDAHIFAGIVVSLFVLCSIGIYYSVFSNMYVYPDESFIKPLFAFILVVFGS